MDKLVNMPIIKTTVIRSKSGRFIIHRTEITDIKPVSYYDKMLNDAVVDPDETIPEEEVELEEPKAKKSSGK